MRDRISATVSVGARLPGVLPRVAVLLLGCSAFLIVPIAPAIISAVCAVTAAIAPSFPAAWGSVLILGVAQLAGPAEFADPRAYLALAIAHLIHVAASLAGVIDARGSFQARLLIPPLRRWLAIQLPAQAALALVLLAHERLAPLAPAVAPILAALGVVVVAVALLRLATRG